MGKGLVRRKVLTFRRYFWILCICCMGTFIYIFIGILILVIMISLFLQLS